MLDEQTLPSMAGQSGVAPLSELSLAVGQSFGETVDVAARRRSLRAARRAGMTLIEIMIVVVIMALVATGVGIAVLPQLEKAKIRQAEAAVATVRGAVEIYRGTNNAECATMSELLEDKTISKSTATTDPWDHDFQIECDGTEIMVRSAGPDGEFDTADDIPKVK
jgi:general secretion pathway protein G